MFFTSINTIKASIQSPFKPLDVILILAASLKGIDIISAQKHAKEKFECICNHMYTLRYQVSACALSTVFKN
jgi:hypothetical protein